MSRLVTAPDRLPAPEMMLPLHPQPLPNEILSSWMVRLALANGFHLHTFYSSLLGCKAPIWNRDTDRHPAPALLKVLSLHTDQAARTLQAMTLSTYDGLLFEELPRIGNASWILPVGVFHRTRRRGGMQFCPLCLQCDPVPYYRRPWRIALYAMCEIHHCIMQEYCPSCQAPVAYHRHGIGRRKVVTELAVLRCCQACGFDLRWTRPGYLDWPDVTSWLMFDALIRFFEQGAWDCGQGSPPCGIQFFQGLRTLVSAINGRNGHRLRQQLKQRLGLSIGTGHPAHRVEFEFLSALERLKLLLAATWLLADWPDRFVQVCVDAGFTRSRLAEEVNSLPFWIASVADEYLDHRPYLPSSAEIYAAAIYLQSHHQAVTPQALGNALGLSRDYARLAWQQWRGLSQIQ